MGTDVLRDVAESLADDNTGAITVLGTRASRSRLERVPSTHGTLDSPRGNGPYHVRRRRSRV